MTKSSRGALIVVEGLDRAGKSSQCERLLRSLLDANYKAQYIRFPDRATPTGKLIDSYLRGETHLDDHAVHLLFSANRWEKAQSIRDDIASGTTVIIDRYSFSGAVYSTAKNIPNLSLDWAWHPEVGLPRPDLCLFLSISPEEAARRGGYGSERYETNAMQNNVRELFTSLVRLPHNDEFCVVDAGKSFDEVAEFILQRVLECLNKIDSLGPLRTFGPTSFIPTKSGELSA
ncbi:hypothetical protein VTN49DRAFT_5146 [Thermomyces lanuginosus]|uniref:uncharacterized protein n=1 Tax=Thermomyces lanuginosus TaxID=5541 RepID=UPI003742799D